MRIDTASLKVAIFVAMHWAAKWPDKLTMFNYQPKISLTKPPSCSPTSNLIHVAWLWMLYYYNHKIWPNNAEMSTNPLFLQVLHRIQPQWSNPTANMGFSSRTPNQEENPCLYGRCPPKSRTRTFTGGTGKYLLHRCPGVTHLTGIADLLLTYSI